MQTGGTTCECTGLIPHQDAQVEDEKCSGSSIAATYARLYYRNLAGMWLATTILSAVVHTKLS
jgi:hypothetical protein